MEVIRTIRGRVGADFPLLFRISADEMVPGGRNLEETKILCRLLVEAGVDALEISRGSLEALRWVVPPMDTPIALNAQYAAEIREDLRVPILVVGRINDPLVAECILEEGKADLVVMARALLVDPDLPRKALSGSYEGIVPCIACNRCLEIVMTGNPVTCSMNPAVGREKDMAIVPAGEPKTVLIVGGGPAGLEAARVASLRGHRVTLYDRTEKLGGQLNIASIPPAKQELAKAIKYFSTQIEKSGVKVEIGKEFTPALIHQSKPDVVIIATGSAPLIPDIPGVNNPRVVTAIDVLSGKVTIGNKALIIGGGMVGSETADYLSGLSVDVTLLEVLENIATDMVIWQKEFLLERLAMRGVKIITSAKVIEILADGVKFIKEGKENSIKGMDNIIIAMGAKSVNELSEKIRGDVRELYIIGDASEPRKVLDAIREGAELGRNI
jgi:NADPH-dependent 2,4-dienoyl-CoA reductase/sulfur reductase-like enzyme